MPDKNFAKQFKKLENQDQHDFLQGCVEELQEKFKTRGEALDKVNERWFEWAELQENNRRNFESSIFEKIEVRLGSLEKAIVQKTEMDSAILSKLSDLAKDIDEQKVIARLHGDVITKLTVEMDVVKRNLEKHPLETIILTIKNTVDRIFKLENVLEKISKRGWQWALIAIASLVSGLIIASIILPTILKGIGIIP